MLEIGQATRHEGLPYPLIYQADYLDRAFYDQLLAEFPSDEEAAGFTRVMGNRRRLASEQQSFYAFLASRPAWTRLYREINSEAFVAQVLERFAPEIAEWGLDPNRAWEFDADRLRRTARDKPVTLFERVKMKFGWRPFQDSKPLPKDKLRFHIHFDISAAYDGYEREIHRDSTPRIAAFLIYFSSAAETGGRGGEFGVHKLRDSNVAVYPEHPADAISETVDLIKPDENLFVMFLNTPNAYHSVPRVEGAKGTRRFIYVGISSEPAFWTGAKGL